MLLEAAMAELRQPDTPIRSPLLPGKPESPSDVHALLKTQPFTGNAVMVTNAESSLFKDDHKERSSSDEFSSSNTGSSLSTSFCEDSSEGISLLQEDNEFVSRVLNREPSNLGESSRFGYRSATVAAGGIPFQWEAEPGKSKNPTTIKEEEEEQVPPLSLPPIRLAAAAAAATLQIPPHISPSHSKTPSPGSLTGKVKNLLINHVKKPSLDHFSILDTQKSPSRNSHHRAKNKRRTSSLSASGGQYASVPSSPYNNYSGTLMRNDTTHVQTNEELYVPRASVNSSDRSSSPYYFSPLSNASSYMSQGMISPRVSTAQSLSGSTPISITHPHISAIVGSHASSRASDSSISSISSSANVPMKAPAMLADCLLKIRAISDDTQPPSLSENESHGPQNSNGSLSFASPEMEILDEEQLLLDANYMASVQQSNKRETSMAEFINRGGPSMNRSFSTSRVTFADDLYRRSAENSRYYSAQLNDLKSSHLSPMKDSANYNTKLDVLFPLKKPNTSSGNLVPKYAHQSDESPDDRQAYVDALDTSLDCSAMTDNEELNSMVQTVMKVKPPKERPAHEVVMQGNDENGFAYSPIASAFVFSPRKTSQNRATNYFKPSTRANIGAGTINASSKCDIHGEHHNDIDQPKSILKKTYSQELNHTQSLSVNAVVDDKSVPLAPYMQQLKSLNQSGSQKISSVLLRFAEAEEQHYSGKKHHQHHHGIRSPTCIQPMCSFLGRALLCRSKLASHTRHLHS